MTDLEVVRYCVRECTGDDGTMRKATHGEYCGRCWGTIKFGLAELGELAQHLAGNAVAMGSSGNDRVDSSRSAPLPFNETAFDDISDVYRFLVKWTGVWADRLGQKPPPVALRAWRNDAGTVMGLPADISAETVGILVERLSRWLIDRLDLALASGYRGDVDELTAAVSDVWKINARWPRKERPAYSPIPCPLPDCGRRIAVYPPAFPGADRHTICDGGHWWTEEQFEHLKLVFQQVAKERVRAAKVAKHLTKKFGWTA